MYLFHLFIIRYNRDDKTIEVIEEENQMESQFGITLILVTVQGTENFSGVQQI